MHCWRRAGGASSHDTPSVTESAGITTATGAKDHHNTSGPADPRAPHSPVSSSQQLAWDMLDVEVDTPTNTCSLPPFTAAEGSLTLGRLDATDTRQVVAAAYEETVHFAANLYDVPLGTIGSKFVNLLTSLYKSVGERGAAEGISSPSESLGKPYCSNLGDTASCLLLD